MIRMKIPFYNIANGIGLIVVILLLEKDFRKKGDYHRFPTFLGISIGTYAIGWLIGHIAAYLQMGLLFNSTTLNEHLNYGFSFFGGFIGALLTFVTALRLFKFDISHSLDRIAPFIPLGHTFGRIGCFLGGCCYGKLVVIGDYSFRFPVQLLSAGVLLLLFIVLYFKRYAINRFFLYLFCYSLFRFLIEFMRGDFRGRLLTPFFSPAQEISLAVLAITTVGIIVTRFRIKRQST